MRVLELTQRLSSAACADEAFRIHGARQMGVEIGALGHVIKKGVKGKWPLLAGTLEGLSGAGFAILRDGLGLRDGGRRQAEQQRGNGNTEQANWGAAGKIGRRGQVHLSVVRLRPGFPVRGSIHRLRVRFH